MGLDLYSKGNGKPLMWLVFVYFKVGLSITCIFKQKTVTNVELTGDWKAGRSTEEPGGEHVQDHLGRLGHKEW